MQITTQDVPYEYEGQPFQGFLAFDDSVKGKRPGMLLVHDQYGLNDYARVVLNKWPHWDTLFLHWTCMERAW